MDNDSKFWIKLWCLIGFVVIVFVITIGGCCIHRNYLVKEMVLNGVSPIEAQQSMREDCGYTGETLAILKAFGNIYGQNNRQRNTKTSQEEEE